MANKTITLRIRLPVYLYKIYCNLAEQQDTSVSELIRQASMMLFDKNNVLMQKELKLMLVKVKKKQINSQLYIVKNMYKRILDMAMSSYFTTGSINMRAVNLCIDMFVDEYENYDDKVRTAIATDFKLTVKRLRDQRFLLQQSDTIKKLKLIEKR